MYCWVCNEALAVVLRLRSLIRCTHPCAYTANTACIHHIDASYCDLCWLGHAKHRMPVHCNELELQLPGWLG